MIGMFHSCSTVPTLVHLNKAYTPLTCPKRAFLVFPSIGVQNRRKSRFCLYLVKEGSLSETEGRFGTSVFVIRVNVEAKFSCNSAL